jgi:hypothetical protein
MSNPEIYALVEKQVTRKRDIIKLVVMLVSKLK